MSEQVLGSLPSDDSGGQEVLIDLRGVETARRSAANEKPLSPGEREQLARDIADIENAAAAPGPASIEGLGRAGVAGHSQDPAAVAPDRRAVVSTALVTAGAVVAIHSFVG